MIAFLSFFFFYLLGMATTDSKGRCHVLHVIPDRTRIKGLHPGTTWLIEEARRETKRHGRVKRDLEPKKKTLCKMSYQEWYNFYNKA